MHLGNYPKSVRHDLWFITKGWCLCVEAIAEGIAIVEIERELFSGDSAGRHWDRLKTGQIPEESDFVGATNAAVTLGWLPRELAGVLTRAFSAKRSINPGLRPRDGWDQTAAQQGCFDLAVTTNSQKLKDHCHDWAEWIEGPDENSPDFSDWLEEKTVGWKIADEEITKENIDLIVERAAIELFEMGIADPIDTLKKSLGRLKRNWPSIQAEINKDMRKSSDS